MNAAVGHGRTDPQTVSVDHTKPFTACDFQHFGPKLQSKARAMASLEAKNFHNLSLLRSWPLSRSSFSNA